MNELTIVRVTHHYKGPHPTKHIAGDTLRITDSF